MGSDSKLFWTCVGPGIVVLRRQLQHPDRPVVGAGAEFAAMNAANVWRRLGENAVVIENDGSDVPGICKVR